MIWQGSLKVYPRVLFGQNFAIRTVSTETVINRVFFFFLTVGKLNGNKLSLSAI